MNYSPVIYEFQISFPCVDTLFWGAVCFHSRLVPAIPEQNHYYEQSHFYSGIMYMCSLIFMVFQWGLLGGVGDFSPVQTSHWLPLWVMDNIMALTGTTLLEMIPLLQRGVSVWARSAVLMMLQERWIWTFSQFFHRCRVGFLFVFREKGYWKSCNFKQLLFLAPSASELLMAYGRLGSC